MKKHFFSSDEKSHVAKSSSKKSVKIGGRTSYKAPVSESESSEDDLCDKVNKMLDAGGSGSKGTNPYVGSKNPYTAKMGKSRPPRNDPRTNDRNSSKERSMPSSTSSSRAPRITPNPSPLTDSMSRIPTRQWEEN